MKEITESGMTFLVDEKKCFHIEKSIFVNSFDGMAKCEFVELREDSSLKLVEAKTSFSNPGNPNDFFKNIQDIVRKFYDSILIVNAVLLRHDSNMDIPIEYKHIDLKKAEYFFYLVIKNHQQAWLPPVSDALKQKMKPIFRLWNIPDVSVKVFNEDSARNKGLIR